MSYAALIQTEWERAFGRIPLISHNYVGEIDESYDVEWVTIGRDDDGWLVGVETMTPSYDRWTPPDWDFHVDSSHPTFEAALARTIALTREEEERRLQEIEASEDDDLWMSKIDADAVI